MKRKLNIDVQQFHQYQQRRKTPSHLKQLNTKKMMTYADGNPSPVLRQVIKCLGMGLSGSGIVCYL
jgi:hypothetical protein